MKVFWLHDSQSVIYVQKISVWAVISMKEIYPKFFKDVVTLTNVRKCIQ